MPFTIADNDEVFNSNQSIWMQTDINALVAGISGDGVVSGCAVTAQGVPDMTLAVALGVVNVAGVNVAVTAGNVTITAANATNPRIDLVVVSNAGVKSVTAGVAASSPKAPDIPANSILLAMVYVPANDIAIQTNQITDKRTFVIPTTPYTRTLLDDTTDIVTRNTLNLGRVFYPESYGAVGDGVTDDTVAIQAAIDAAGATGGVVVFKTGSTYKLTPQSTVTGDSLTTPYCLKITATHGNIRLEGNNAKLFLADTQASNSILLLIRGSSVTKRTARTTVHALEFYSNPATQTAWTDFGMLEVAYSDNVTIERCYFHDSPFFCGQVFRSSENSLIRENRFIYSTYGNGFRIEILTGRVLNNIFEGDPNLTKACLDLSCNSDITIQGERLHILGNLFKSGYIQIALAGQRGTIIADNVLYGATNTNGIAIAVSHYSHVTTPYNCTDCLIANNIIYGCRQGIVISGVALNGVSGLMVVNNQIVEDTTLVNLTTGISEQNISTVLNNIIVGNRIIGATTGISAAGAPANGTQIRDNMVDTTFGGHAHAAADIGNLDASKITTGTMPQARLGTGSGGAGLKYLADDQTYKTPPTAALRPTTIAVFRSGVGSTSLTAPPAGVSEPFARLRTKVDLTNYTQMRIVANIVTNGPTGGQIAIQYSTDQTTWNYMDNSAGPVCAVDTGNSTLSVGAYVTLNAAANADVFLRFITQNGNGTTAFIFGNVDIQVK